MLLPHFAYPTLPVKYTLTLCWHRASTRPMGSCILSDARSCRLNARDWLWFKSNPQVVTIPLAKLTISNRDTVVSRTNESETLVS